MEGIGRGKSLVALFKKLEAKNNDAKHVAAERSQFDDAPVILCHKQKEDWNLPDIIKQPQVDDIFSEKPLQRHASFDSQSSLESDSGCICNRNREKNTCDSCGHTFLGRVRKKCELHKNVIHLMDVADCSNCGASF